MNHDKQMQDFAALVGRILLAVIFVVSGYGKIGNFAGTAAYMASKGLPLANILLVPTILIELGGGLMLMVGYRTRLAAIALFLFLIPVTLVFHNFWAAAPAELQMQTINFMKNVAIMGGMLMVAAFGPGRLSLDKS